MTYPRVAFVDQPSTDAAVLFDFNTYGELDDPTSPNADGFSLGAPSLSGDVDAEGIEYGPRNLSFTLTIEGAKAVAVERMSALARECLRRRGWLLFQLSEYAAPVWFRTYRTEPQAISFDQVTSTSDNSRDRWQIAVTIPADPFAYGEEVTVGPVTVNNDPAAGTNPCSYELPSILGDAPAPLSVLATPSVTWSESRVLMALAAHVPGGSPGLVFWQTGAFTAVGADTSAATPDGSMSGGSRASTTFTSTANLATRLSGPAPSTPKGGRYKVLCRVHRVNQGDAFSFRFGQHYGSSLTRYGDTVTLGAGATTASTVATYIDLGVFSFPMNYADWSLADVTTVPAPDIELQVGRTSGSGNIYLDAFVLIPVDTASTTQVTTLVTHLKGSSLSPTRTGVWDADKAAFRAMNSTTMANEAAPIQSGDYLEVVPGATNVLHLHHQTGGSDPAAGRTTNADIVSASASVTMSYYPRWLYLADA